jgi:membrane peptidoglycan carboxypeptidase
MASAYGTIATGGMRHEPYLIEKIVDRDGQALFQHHDAASRVLGQQSTCLASQVLEQNVLHGTGTRARLPNRPAAGKTGTAQRFDDAWFVGFTPQLATAVWMGAPAQKEPMTNVGGIRVVGGSYPAMIWGRYMSGVLAGDPVIPFPTCAATRHGEFLRLGDNGRSGSEQAPSSRRRRATTTTTTRKGGRTTTTDEPTTTTRHKGKPSPTTSPPQTTAGAGPSP